MIILYNAQGGATVDYYLPTVANLQQPEQYAVNTPVKLYADSFAVGSAYAGFAPAFMILNVAVSGHLINIP